MRRDLALDLVADIRQRGQQIRRLDTQLTALITPLAPALLAIVGINVVSAAKILGEVAGITRFRSAAAFAMHTGTAPIPVWSSNRPRSTAAATGNSTPAYTASPSPNSASAPPPRPGASNGPTATPTPPAKPHYAPSNATWPTSSTTPSTPTININSHERLDIEASFVVDVARVAAPRTNRRPRCGRHAADA